jgi:adenylate kinase family enzyme
MTQEKSVRHFLYIRGNPGVGKITVARLLEKELGWRVFWFHDLKNAVYSVVKEHRIPRLMDEVTAPVMKYLLDAGDDIIYVRPSPDKETVETVQEIVKQYPDYVFHAVRLEASYETLLERSSGRNDPFRICDKQSLDEYLDSRKVTDIPGEYIIQTDGATPDAVVKKVVDFVTK